MKKLFILAAIFAATSVSAPAALDTAKIDNLTGLKGKMNEKEGVYKVTFPRNDVKVVVDGWTMPPFMGLGTWTAFKETKAGAMVMGDTVLFEDEASSISQKFFSCTSKAKAALKNWLAPSKRCTTPSR